MPDTTSAVLDHPGTTTAQPSGTEPAAPSTTGVTPTGDTPASQQPDPTAGATTSTVDDSLSTELLSAEELAAVKDDPAAKLTALNKAWTQKTQKLAAERKALGNWAQVREAYSKDPKSTLAELAKQAGLEIRDPNEQATTAATTAAGDKAAEALKGALAKVGLEELADDLTPVFRQIAEEAASKTTEPLRKYQDDVIRESADRETAAVLEAFGKEHPDWKDHEPAMVELMAKFPPATDAKTGQRLVPERDYLEHIYDLATKPLRETRTKAAIKQAAAELVEQMRKSAENAEPSSSGIGGDKVKTSAPPKAGFREAAAAAKRGERWG